MSSGRSFNGKEVDDLYGSSHDSMHSGRGVSFAEETEDYLTNAFSLQDLNEEDVVDSKGRTSVIDDNYDENLNFEFHSDPEEGSEEVSSTDSASTYIQQKELVSEPDFFEQLGEVPNLDDISLSVEVIETIYKGSLTQSTTQIVQDVGRFYDPLTGELLQSSSSSQIVPERDVKEAARMEEEFEEEQEEDDDFLLLPYETDDDDKFGQELVQQDTKEEERLAMEQMIQLEQMQKMQVTTEFDYEAWDRAETARQVLYNTHEFIHNLIENVVQYCEDETPIMLLRQNLDKIKLMQILREKLDDLDSEHKVRLFLNRKSVEHFRRKKHFRAISSDNPDTVDQDIEKLDQTTKRLDQLLGREEEIKRIMDEKVTKLEREHMTWKTKSATAVIEFHNLVQNTLRLEIFVRLKLSVENNLNRMHKFRLEISKTRYKLLLRQHTLATLMEKLAKMEQIGKNLHMRDFERLSAETQALGRKIEERNAEWNKLRLRRTSDLHIMAHMKERQTMLANTISIQEIALRELRLEKQDARHELYEMKMERSRLRNEIRELSFQGGLLDKPALMRDYDQTVERLAKMHEVVLQSQEKHAELAHRIYDLELKTEHSDELLYDSTSFI